MSKKGGYKVVDMSTATQDEDIEDLFYVKGLYEAIESNYDKALLFSGLKYEDEDGNIQTYKDFYSEVKIDGGNFIIKNGEMVIRIDDADSYLVFFRNREYTIFLTSEYRFDNDAVGTYVIKNTSTTTKEIIFPTNKKIICGMWGNWDFIESKFDGLALNTGDYCSADINPNVELIIYINEEFILLTNEYQM